MQPDLKQVGLFRLLGQHSILLVDLRDLFAFVSSSG
jgi:hypothetical protein